MSTISWLVAGVVWAAAEMKNPYLLKAKAQLEAMDEASALKSLEKAQQWPNNTPQELAQVHLYLGLAHAGLSHRKEAVSAFSAALLLDHDIKLPDEASPRIRELWVKAGGKLSRREGDAPEVEKEPAATAPVAEVTPPPKASTEPAPAPVREQPKPRLESEVSAARSTESTGPRVLPWVSGAGAAVTLGFGLGGLAYSWSVKSAFDRQQSAGMELTVSRSDAATAQVLASVSVVSLVVGGVLLTVCIVSALMGG